MLSACLAEQPFSWTLSLPFYQRSCESPFWKDDDSEDDLIGQSLWIFSVETIQVFKGFPRLGYLIPRHRRMCETVKQLLLSKNISEGETAVDSGEWWPTEGRIILRIARAFFDVSNWKAQDSHDLPRLVSFKENHRISLSLWINHVSSRLPRHSTEVGPSWILIRWCPQVRNRVSWFNDVSRPILEGKPLGLYPKHRGYARRQRFMGSHSLVPWSQIVGQCRTHNLWNLVFFQQKSSK